MAILKERVQHFEKLLGDRSKSPPVENRDVA
jgi:hypothetical protein